MWLDNNWLNHVNLDAFKQIRADLQRQNRAARSRVVRARKNHRASTAIRASTFSTHPSVMGAVRADIFSSDRSGDAAGTLGFQREGHVLHRHRRLRWTEGSGTDYYDGDIAHEFQHLILDEQDPNEDTWVSEGMSELAIFLNGDDPEYDALAARLPIFNSIRGRTAAWPASENYGTAFSFMLYFWDRYGDAGVQALAAEPANGLAGIQKVLDKIDPGKTGGRSGGRLADRAPVG